MIGFLKRIFAWYFTFKGWKIEGGIPRDVKKCVLVAAPHTSNWDFIFGLGALQLYKYDVKYLAKKELFFFPFRKVFLDLGGIPVDRSKSNSLVDSLVDLINSREELVLLFPPEATRKPVTKWKSGFYWAALKAKVPIALGILDYKKKTANIGLIFQPSGDKEKDWEIIRNYYKDASAKHPGSFSLPEGV